MGRPRTEGPRVYTFWKTNKKTNVQYLVERIQQYNPETKRMETISEKTLSQKRYGENGEQEECRPKRSPSNKDGKSENTRPLTVSKNHSELNRILEWIGKESGIDEDLRKVYKDSGIDKKIISCARYLLATKGQTLIRICEWELTHKMPYKEGFSKDILSRLKEELGTDEEGRMNYFRNRAERLGSSKLLILACDSSTTIMSSKHHKSARSGYNKQHVKAESEKTLTLYDQKNNQPIAFVKQPGNIPDVSSLLTALYMAKGWMLLLRILMVFDNGFTSLINMYYCFKTDFDFLARVEITDSWVKKELDKIIDELISSNTLCNDDGTVVGKTVCLFHEFTGIDTDTNEKETLRKKVYLHFYLNTDSRQDASRKLRRHLASLKKQLIEGIQLENMSKSDQEDVRKFLRITEKRKRILIEVNESAITAELKYEGVFALVGRGKYPESRETDLSLPTYFTREHIERHYEEDNQDMDGENARTWSDETYVGKKMIQFVGLGYEDWFYAKLNSLKKELLEEIEESNRTGKNKTKAAQALQLYNWLKGRSLVQILDWYDAYETTEVSYKLRQLRWSDAQLKQDKYFFERLGIE